MRAKSIERILLMKKGDLITNICAGDKNPTKYSRFDSYVKKTTKNKYKIEHVEYFVKCTDGKRKWLTEINVIYPGRLSSGECKKLFSPVWELSFK